jgi:hypothetical protein
MAERLDDLVAAAVQAWVTVAGAWIEAANAIGVAWLDLPAVESGRPGFNEEIVALSAQRAPTALHPEAFSDWDDNKLPREALIVEPDQVNAGEATNVRLLVQPPKDTTSGTYTGSLCDSSGACLVDEIGVYVVGDTPPLPRGGVRARFVAFLRHVRS